MAGKIKKTLRTLLNVGVIGGGALLAEEAINDSTNVALENINSSKPDSVYVVKEGDYLSKIAAGNDSLYWNDIAKANNLFNPDLIQPGDTLKIPYMGDIPKDSVSVTPVVEFNEPDTTLGDSVNVVHTSIAPDSSIQVDSTGIVPVDTSFNENDIIEEMQKNGEKMTLSDLDTSIVDTSYSPNYVTFPNQMDVVKTMDSLQTEGFQKQSVENDTVNLEQTIVDTSFTEAVIQDTLPKVNIPYVAPIDTTAVDTSFNENDIIEEMQKNGAERIASDSAVVDSTDFINYTPLKTAAFENVFKKIEDLEASLTNVDSAVVDTPEVNIPYVAPMDTAMVDTQAIAEPVHVLTVGEGLEEILAKATELYAASDVETSKYLNNFRKNSEQNLGSSKTYTDDNDSSFVNDLKDLRKNLGEILTSYDFPMGTAGAINLGMTLANLENTKDLTEDELKRTNRVYSKFKEQTRNSELLPDSLQLTLNENYQTFENRIGNLEGRLVELDSTIDYVGGNLSGANGFANHMGDLVYGANDNPQEIVDSFRDVYNQEKARQDPASFKSWVEEFLNPQIDQVMGVNKQTLEEYLPLKKLKKLAKKSDSEINDALIKGMEIQRNGLIGANKALRTLKNQDPSYIEKPVKEKGPSFSERWQTHKAGRLEKRIQRKVALEQNKAKINEEYKGVLIKAGFGINTGKDGFSEAYGGLRVGNFGARVKYGGAADETLADFKNPSVEISKKNVDLNSLGVDLAYHKGNAYFGTGINNWQYTQKIVEDIYRNGVLVDPNRESKSKGYKSVDVFAGYKHQIGDGVNVGLEIGHDSKYGLKGGINVDVPLNKHKDKSKSKK